MNQKQKITSIVEDYKVRFEDEYTQFCQAIAEKREAQKDQFASTGADGAIGQMLHEVPLTLYNLLMVKLDKEDKRFYQSKIGAEWFGRTFKEFSPAEKI